VKQRRASEWRRTGLVALLTAAFMWLLLYAPTPFVVFEPGLAVPAAPMVKAEEGDEAGEGAFLLTAVKMIEPNMWNTLRAMADVDRDVYLKSSVLNGYTKKEYAERLTVVMEGSQNNAVEAAYRYLGLPYQSITTAIVVTDVKQAGENGGASFKAGDRLLGISGGRRFHAPSDIVEELDKAKGQKTISFEVERAGEPLTVTAVVKASEQPLTAASLPAALGVSGLTELRSLEPADAGNSIKVSAGSIGGPSAGLVFALQVIDLLTSGDMTGGRRIAATGTIAPDGTVGAIGGIKQKVVITSKEGAELFLVPANNYKEAAAKAKAIGTDMEIVSVETLSDAVRQVSSFIGASTAPRHSK